MIKITNECVGCSSLGLPCRGSSCSNRHVTRIYCDVCGEEIDYDSNRWNQYVDYHVCEDCEPEEEEE